MSEQTGMVIRPPQGGSMQTMRQGFGEQSIELRNTAAVAMAERARAEVQARYVVAIQRPRNVDEFRVRLLDHCKRARFAEAARYRKPIGASAIEGASIRFVETALAEYGNVLPESAIVFEDDEQLVLRVTVTDLERNITHAAEATITKRVERRRVRQGQHVISQRMNSSGELVYLVEATDDEVANAKAARESKLIRNLGLRILPRDVVDEAQDQCLATLRDRDAKDPAGERRKLVDAFHAIGVSPSDLVAYLGHPLEQIQPAEIAALREFYTAVRDGDTTWADVLETKAPRGEAAPASQPARGTAAVKAELAKRQAAAGEAAPASAPPAAAETERDTKPANGRRGRAANSPPAAAAQPALPTAPAAAASATEQPAEPYLAQELRELELTIDRPDEDPSWASGVEKRIDQLPDGMAKAKLWGAFRAAMERIELERAAADAAARATEGGRG